jgi:hypothetical protein
MRLFFDAETQRRGDDRRAEIKNSALISASLRLCVNEKASFDYAPPS